ncbi:MAG TPA: DHH family phosphoesterase [Candidatus Binataceae bacterium]|jgi:nanoRNase/pAp phosphatase (c-di-AMP/oligoRNAs hydrolase)|nr:DHH family phosphoesterase [Candidatus Binataceae bacterium]
MDQSYTRERLKELRALVRDSERVAILLQDDPDPDAIASGIALRTLLGRNKQTTPLFSFSDITRPENRAMVQLLEIEVDRATPELLDTYDKVAMVDVQPPYFNGRLHRADIVIDHHPGYSSGNAAFEDVRIRYGASSTILTEYLISAGERISERLATALLYGIKSDTLMLSRRVTEDDLQAFTYLYPLANYNLLRRIERPELPLSFARILARAMGRMTVRDELAVVHLGPVKRDDLIVQMADFCLQFEGAEWVAVSGKLGGNLVIAVRNHGAGRSAGDVVRKLFSDIGSAGGHRNMSKAVIPLSAWRRREGSSADRFIETRLRELFALEIIPLEEDGDARG